MLIFLIISMFQLRITINVFKLAIGNLVKLKKTFFYFKKLI